MGLLKKDHILALDQFQLTDAPPPTASPGKQKNMKVAKGESMLTIEGENFQVGFDLKNGVLSSWKSGSTELLVQGPMPNFRRAPTDNDIGNGMPKRCQPWFNASEQRVVLSVEVTTMSGTEVMVETEFLFPDSIASETITYRIIPDGTITVTARLKPLKEKLPELPRFGINMEINPVFDKVSWFGRGPWENYCDRKTSSFVGLYESTVEALFTPYIRPQENGYRTDVRWMMLENREKTSIMFTGQPLLCFSALPYTYDDMKGFKQGGKHLHDLVKKPFVDVNIDYGQTGVGGDDSWGARPHEPYTLKAKEYGYSFRMRALVSSK
jgi:beta-galactosidase